MSGRRGGGTTSGLAALACTLLAGTAVMAGLVVNGPALAQQAAVMQGSGRAEFSGAPIAAGAAGAGSAAGQTSAGQMSAGQGASLMASLGEDNAPFDMTGTRSRVQTANIGPTGAVPASGPSAPETAPANPPAATPIPATSAPEASGSGAAPAIGSGAPTPGAATPGVAHPGAATPAADTGHAATEQPAPSSIATLIGDLTATQIARFTARSSEQQALAGFYAARGNEPVFTAGHGWSPLGVTALQQFAASGQDGLQPADYQVPALSAHPTDAEMATAELKLAATLLLYARHVQSGRFDPTKLSANVDPSPTVPDPAVVLTEVAGAVNPRAVLDGYAPQYDEYRLLKARLAALQAERRTVAVAPIPAGPTMRPGDEDARVPLLRARLGVPGAGDDYLYGPSMVEAMRAFQRSVGEKPDGVLGPMTLAALNGQAGTVDRTADLISNMERWRWLPHQVAPAYVIVNIPEYMARIVVDEKTIHETRVVVGKPENQTPLLTENMQYAVFNPSWNVPPGIIRNEMLPKLRNDPYALERQGIDVVRNGRVVDPGTVDWSRGTQGYAFRQPPGERNALGNMKFMFPNKHSVYLHDTPSRALFARDRRAFSHGCVRVFEPMKFAEVLFSLGLPGENWNEQRISKLIGGNEKYLNLKQRFPVHLVYFTTYVDEQGRLAQREDLYGIDAAVKATLGLGGTRQMADRGVAPTQR